jgi:hypothetical protein
MRDLGVELILANSPQAKGRVERRNGLLQDRLVKEMRLRRIGTIEAANAFLDETYLAELNAAYTRPAADPADAHRPVDKGLDLAEVLCTHEQRVVGRDWCVRWRNGWLQIDAGHGPLALPGKRVTVKALADGTLLLLDHRGRRLRYRSVGSHRPEHARPKAVSVRRTAPSIASAEPAPCGTRGGAAWKQWSTRRRRPGVSGS